MQWQRNTKKAFATCLHSCNKPRSYPFVNESKNFVMVKIKPRFKYDKTQIEKLFRQLQKGKNRFISKQWSKWKSLEKFLSHRISKIMKLNELGCRLFFVSSRAI